MPKQEPLPTVPLKEEEKEHLLIIYNTRLRYFSVAFSIILAYAIYVSFSALGRDMSESYDYEILGHVLTRTELYLFAVTVSCSIFIIPGIRIYFKRILAYKRDALSGVKEIKSYTIVDKKYFSNTDQFFFSFDDPNYMHYEVTHDVYLSYNVGDKVPVYRAVRSKYVFEKDGRFTFM